MSAPSLSEQLALVAADPALAGHPVVALVGELVERLEELAAYLRYVQHLPVAQLRDLLRELQGVGMSTGAVEALCRRAAAQLGKRTLAMPMACMDETSLRVVGERVWLHVICDGKLTFHRLGNRGDVWKAYRGGTAVHDRFVSYFSQLPAGTAHLLRNLEEIVERKPTTDSWAARKRGQPLPGLLRLDPDAPWLDTVPS